MFKRMLLFIALVGAVFFTFPQQGLLHAEVIEQPFHIKIDTTKKSSLTISLNVLANYSDAYKVDWGDGIVETLSSKPRPSHTYASHGVYDIKVYNTISPIVSVYLDSGGESLIEVIDFGEIGLTSLSFLFENAFNLTVIPSILPISITDLSNAFDNLPDFNLSAVSNWNTSHVTLMKFTFSNASMFNQSLSGWDTSNVTVFNSMFKGALAFNQDISMWHTSNVTETISMFNGATSFNQDLKTWDMSKVTNMSSMFQNASAFDSDISNWDTSSVLLINSMFSNAKFNQDITGWDLSSLEGATGMFAQNSHFNQDISVWNMPNLKYASSMFSDAKAFNQPIGVWDTTHLLNIDYMFKGALSFNQPLDSWDTSRLTSLYSVFEGAILFNQDLSSWDTSNVTIMNNTFDKASAFNGDISTWDVSNVHTFNAVFKNATSFNSDISNWHTINGEYFYQMFSGASKFNQGLSGWDFSSAKDIQYFYDTINPALTMTNFSSIIERLTQTLPVVTGTARRIHFDKVYHLLGDAQSITNILSNKNWRIISKGIGYTFTFLDNDDNIIVEYVKGIGETLRAPAKPADITGYTFKHYSRFPSYGILEANEFYTVVEYANITYRTSFQANQYTITFDSSGGTIVNSIYSLYNRPITEPTAPQKYNVDFDGWYEDYNYTMPFVFDKMPAEDIQLYAKWAPKSYTIDFETFGGDVVAPIRAYENALVTAPDAPTKEGHTFIGWYTSQSFSNIFVFDKMLNVDRIAYAKFLPNSYMVTFVTNGGNVLSPESVQYGTSIDTITRATKTGYKFIRYYSNEELTMGFPSDKMPANDITVYASWTIESYKLTYIDQDLNVFEQIYEYQESIPSSVTPLPSGKVGHTFESWSQALPLLMPAGDLTIEAQYNANQYTMSFVTNGGSIMDAISKDYGEIISITSPNKEGYIFSGWFSDAGLINPYVISTMPAEDKILYASYGINSYTLQFIDESGVVYNDTFEYGADLSGITLPSPALKVGYTFDSWDQTLPATMPANNLVITATYTINQYSATFKDHDGTELSVSTVDYLTSAVAPTSPTRVGYTFTGWDTDFSSMTSNIDVAATYTINQFSATFKDHDGTQLIISTVDYLTSAVASTNPTRVGYTFTGWDTDFSSMTANIDVVATYTINSYDVIFKDYDGTELQRTSYEYNADLTGHVSPVNPTRTGYTFDSWNLVLPGLMPASHLEIAAQYNINSYTLQFIDDSGVLYNDTFEYGADLSGVILPSPSLKVGYTFNSWDQTLPATMPENNVVITALYDVNFYTLSVKDGYKVLNEYILSFDDEVNVTNPIKDGCRFNGWSIEIPSRMPSTDIELLATWTSIEIKTSNVTVSNLDHLNNLFTSQGTNLNLKLQFEELSKQAWVYKDKLKDINQAFGKNMKLIT